ncbi:MULTISPECIES: S8 family serine peptidase [unclassified Sphingobium]|uniref:S8 family serine peptidase n=1 Tax=unclassified Sphingobium TaxID=2611147 RepID=UPI002224D79C|nr:MULTISPECIES: S8 family serine peptidase [unclassified Sphingobium]MCW2410704.1 hypothetical protein [Sphingobium sp. B8D3D]MCW2417007.1 hypothetical protein [Sphingobium sp. B8D3A]
MRHVIAFGSVVALLTLAGCGGGGGALNSTPTPAPAPTPTPTPTPAPTPAPTPSTVNYDTSEYRNSSGLPYHGAITAYQAGASGAGVTVGVVDSGLSDPTGEFTGRISAASADFAGNSSYADVEGHGTAVSAVLAAGRNNRRVMGMAWGATVMALRTDDQSDCDANGCKHSTTAIANAIDHARINGARIINVSLGGGAAPNYLLQAVKRATQAGIIIVISAGNNEDGQPMMAAPDELAQSFANPAYSNGLVIIAPSVNSNDTVSSFSAGVAGFESVSIAALGSRVLSFDHTGTDYLYSGTSFAAPQVAGAAALLADAFPNLTSAQIVALLKNSARDVGAPGADARYGVGILDIAKAFQPVGALSMAGTQIALSPLSTGILSAPMGDATPAALDAVALDDYQRAYRVDLTPRFARPAPRREFAAALDTAQRHLNLGTPALSLSLNLRPTVEAATTRDPFAFRQSDEARTRLLSGTLSAQIAPHARVMLGLRTGIAALEQRLADRAGPSFLMADHGFDADHADRQAHAAVTVSQQLSPALTVIGGFERGDMQRAALADAEQWRATPYHAASLSLDYQRGAIGLTAGTTMLDEQATLLGARFSANFGAQSARSLFTRLGARADLPGAVRLSANWQRGWTRAAAGGALREGGSLVSQSWSADLARGDLFAPGDLLGLRISQPLRVIASRFTLIVPQTWDWEQEIATDARVPLNLVPRGRQRDYELSYGRGIGPGWLGANLFLREQGSNIAAIPDELGMALRWSVGF